MTIVSVDVITEPASARFASMTAAMRSSIVPGHTSVWTTTPRVWPMRHTRSDAWSSTAGFHQRSKWITWFARTRLSPVPPACSDTRARRAPVPREKRSTISSRRVAGDAAVQHRHLEAELLARGAARCGAGTWRTG